MPSECPVRVQVGATDEVWLTGEHVVIDRSTSAIISPLNRFDSHSESSPIGFLWRFFWPYPTVVPPSGLRGPTTPLTLLLTHFNNAVQHHRDVEYIHQQALLLLPLLRLGKLRQGQVVRS